MKKGPKTVSWYICGRGFGTTSYGIHYTQCKKKFADDQARLDKAERKKLPDAPDGIDDILNKKKISQAVLEAYNQTAIEIWNSKSLSKCSGCSRTFNHDSLKVHMRSCKGVKSSGAASSTSAGSHLGGGLGGGSGGMGGGMGGGRSAGSKSPNRGPKSIVCYICGKGFMKGSITIHLPQCKDKFKKESVNLGVKRKLPSAPPELDNLLGKTTMTMKDIEEYNNVATKSYNESGLMKWPNCSRTFLPDSLKSHMKSCNNKHGTDHDPFASKKKKTAKPLGIMCYICGREYFSKSLDIHITQCKEAWLRDEKLKPKKDRRKWPQPPKDFEDIVWGKVTEENKQAYNDDAYKEYNEKALVPCPNCARTFLPDSLVKHLKSCGSAKGKGKGKSPVRGSPTRGIGKKGVAGGVTAPKSKISKPKKKVAVPGCGPPGVTCYICGRKYGTKSIDIHVTQWIDLWEKTEANKLKSERRPVPQKPKMFEEMKISPMGSKAMDEYNDEAFKNYNETALVPCDIWARTFLPESLIRHQKSCKPKGEKKVPVKKKKY